MAAYVIPPGVVGIQGTAAAFTRAEADLGVAPTPGRLVSPLGVEIRLYRAPHAEVDDLRLIGYGLVVLLPGTSLEVAV